LAKTTAAKQQNGSPARAETRDGLSEIGAGFIKTAFAVAIAIAPQSLAIAPMMKRLSPLLWQRVQRSNGCRSTNRTAP
jgi:hypothetical protein